MDYAFSLVKLETLSVEEFLQLDGDEGWLIAKNLIVCAECRGNVFLRRGEKRACHFAHAKFREGNEGCTKRVGSYTPDKIRRVRFKQSRYRVGYFQQRFEDYLFLSLLDTLRSSNLFFVSWGWDERDCSYVIALDKMCDSDEDRKEKLRLLRGVGHQITKGLKTSSSNEGVAILANAATYWLRMNRELLQKAGEEAFCEIIANAFVREGTDSKDPILIGKVVGQLSGIRYQFNSSDKKFAVESIRHLLSRGAEPLVAAATAAAMQLFLSTELSSVWREHANIGVFEKDKYGMGLDFLYSYLDDSSKDPHGTLTSARLLRAWMQIMEEKGASEVIGRLKEFERILVEYGEQYNQNWSGGDKPFYAEMYSFISRLFKFINFAQTAAAFYGDEAESPDELRLRAADQERGFVYIAWAPYLKEIWKEDLLRLGFLDCAKIGRSDDPERRINEVAGNMGPADSVEIVCVYPVFDMIKAEQFVHNKLKKRRLSPRREIFAFDQLDEVIDLVSDLINQFQSNKPESKPQSKSKRVSNRGFGG